MTEPQLDPLHAILRKLAGHINEVADAVPPGALKMLQCKVIATHAAPNTVDIQIGGSTTNVLGVRYASGYTPAVNDIVWAFKQGTDLVVAFKLA